jgi:hypothetical protein
MNSFFSLLCPFLNFECLINEFLHPAELDLECECVFLGDVNYLIDNKLLVSDQFRGVKCLPDDLQHEDVSQR